VGQFELNMTSLKTAFSINEHAGLEALLKPSEVDMQAKIVTTISNTAG
jgi:hypothetical protein